jgi:hypothetical protein
MKTISLKSEKNIHACFLILHNILTANEKSINETVLENNDTVKINVLTNN